MSRCVWRGQTLITANLANCPAHPVSKRMCCKQVNLFLHNRPQLSLTLQTLSLVTVLILGNGASKTSSLRTVLDFSLSLGLSVLNPCSFSFSIFSSLCWFCQVLYCFSPKLMLASWLISHLSFRITLPLCIYKRWIIFPEPIVWERRRTNQGERASRCWDQKC